jgi:L-galactose dehydrogenase
MNDIPERTYRTLGRTGLRVSRVGLGTGGPSRLGLSGGGGDELIERLVRKAVDLGINLIDTAPGYGTESGLGKALRGVREPVFVATKVWCYEDEDVDDSGKQPIVDPGHVISSVERSLQALRRETIDVLQLHGVPPSGLAAMLENLVPAMVKLREQGKIRFLGITEHPGVDHRQEMAMRACESDLFDTLMIQYGIFDQVAERCTFGLAEEHGVGIFGMCAARGAWTDAEALRRVLEQVDPGGESSLEFLLRGSVVSYADAAYRFAAAREEIPCLLVGTGNPDHLVESTVAILCESLPAAHVQMLEERFGDLDGAVLWPEYQQKG